MKNQSDLTNDLMSAYSSVEIYDIDSYKNARLIYSYDENKSLFFIYKIKKKSFWDFP